MKYKYKIMGVLNVTPDSFSDGGRYLDIDDAVAHGLKLARDGASIIDVGGESTRPGAQRVSGQAQIARIVPVIEKLKMQLMAEELSHVQISIDTTRIEVVEMAVNSGATFINDISAGEESPEIFDLVREKSLDICLMHKQGAPRTMQDRPRYEDVAMDVHDYLIARAEIARSKGIAQASIYIDPGLGFGKKWEDNHTLINSLNIYKKSNYKILIGASRKRFLRALCEKQLGEAQAPPALKAQAPPALKAQTPPALKSHVREEDLDLVTTVTSVLGYQHGVSIFRVHNVAMNALVLHTLHNLCQHE